MKFRTIAASLAAVSLAAAPAVAQFERSAAPVEGQSELAEGSTLLWSAVAIAAFVGAVILVTDDDDDEPVSAG
ncbi:hypothetical protein GRI38_01285 [Altererythrobacter aurantiacus]|uniref:MYXO-CTERM domain-containing protein n=1 Tax=Parapontixanthobacter aurantiacus TaxID=1463599 RepID=A0A844ZCD2_9SPHN|nr:hypothetical protein [Parapontixanthobacter aurantiacus]MXO84667.1 hypothetical protein [Parapontixanthobacter aurantiacus]